MTATEILEQEPSKISLLCRKFGVEKLSLFGSALRSDWDLEKSDIDFVAVFGTPPPGIDLFAQQFVFQVEISSLLGRPVDIVDWAAVKKPLFKEVVSQTAKE